MHFYALARHVALATGSITYFAITSTAISFLEEFFGTNWSIYPSDVNSRQMFDGFPVSKIRLYGRINGRINLVEFSVKNPSCPVFTLRRVIRL